MAKKTIAYIRASTDKQDVDNQKLELLEYARKHDLKVDDFIQITISSRRTGKGFNQRENQRSFGC
ncbi:MAG: recombinase family protein [Saprospiraceae bacterium]|jgi:DNA invertase Pin-like site-specific DNA recombinase|nr:recombinase family protein [Saprospiraceae bacterium]